MKSITRLRSLVRNHGDLGALIALICIPYIVLVRNWARQRQTAHHHSTDPAPLAWGAIGSLVLLCTTCGSLYFGHHLAPASCRCAFASGTTAEIFDLGTLPNGGGSYAFAINDRGQVVGTADTGYRDEEDDPIYHAWLWQKGVLQDIGTLGACSRAIGINAQGQIVGTSWISPAECYAFLWQNGKMRNLGSLGGQRKFSWGDGINNKAQIVGATSAADDEWHPFLWQDGKMRMLDPTERVSPGSAVAINDRGDVVGTIYGARAVESYLVTAGRMTRIPPMGGVVTAVAALNARTQVVGGAEIQRDGDYHAFVWEPGQQQPRDLGTLGGKESFASGINSRGEIVGEAETTSGLYHAALWHDNDSKAYDLNDALPAGSGWTLFYACGINTSGQIVGVGKHNGQTRGFLLTPHTAALRM